MKTILTILAILAMPFMVLAQTNLPPVPTGETSAFPIHWRWIVAAVVAVVALVAFWRLTRKKPDKL